MSKPVCYANDTVKRNHIERVQQEADENFPEAHAVLDEELLSKKEKAARERALAAQTKLGDDGLLTVARVMTHKLFPPKNFHFRTSVNVYRLVNSERVTTKDVIGLVKLLENPDKISEFHKAAQEIFLGAQLFYYDYVAHQGAIMCYHPLKK